MHIRQVFSHLNGEEFLLIRQQTPYLEVRDAIEAIRFNSGKEGSAGAQTTRRAIARRLKAKGWIQSSTPSYLVKERVAVEIPWGNTTPKACNLFARHLASYVGDQIDVGIEILPMKSLQAQMSSGVSYYEGELYNVVRQGRGVPAVPLVIVGIDA